MRRARFVCALFCGQFSAFCLLMAEPPSRIHEHHLSKGETFTLTGNVHPLTSSAVDQGEVDSSLALSRLTIHFRMTAAQQADLNQLLNNLQDRNSPQYHKFLSTKQYGDRFGISQSDMQKVVTWLESEGFTNVGPALSRTSVSMSGNASQVQSAFQVPLHRYELNGASHFANAGNPVLPKALREMVLGIRGLDDFHPRAHNSILRPHFTSAISGNHYITPDDFATIYDLHTLYNAGIDGTGVSIAVVGQTDITLSDIQAFRSAAGLPAKDPVIQLVGVDPGTSKDDISEADLDIEMAGAVARNATIIFVNSTDAFTSLDYAITNNLAPVVSVSYGTCEPSGQSSGGISALEADLRQASATGITVVGAAGDTGAADCDSSSTGTSTATHGLAVDFPASSPYVTGVGGSEFTDGSTTGATQYWSASNNASNGSALSYIPEQVWNDTTQQGILAASGGGASTSFTKPSWQQGTGVPNDGARDVPDISFQASPSVDPVLICSNGWCTNGFRNSGDFLDATGGTSVGAPAFAGVVALIIQKAGGSVGNVNPTLYELASVSSNAFHDITSGDNLVPCQAGSQDCPASGSLGYAAGVGYDQATGLGSVDVTNLVNEWPDFSVTLNPTAVTIAAGGTSSVAINVTRTQLFSGQVSFTCSSSVSTLTCTAPGPLTNSGSASLTITRASNSAIWLPRLGTWRIAASFYGIVMVGGLIVLLLKRRQMVWGGVMLAALAMAGCGGSSSPSVAQTITPVVPQTATVTVTATSGLLKQTATVTVTLD